METQPTQDFVIPDTESKFTLLPEEQEVTFSNLGELKHHVQNEIAAWTNIENTIANKYKCVLEQIEIVANDAKDGCIATGALTEVKKTLSEWTVNGTGINSCVVSNSRLGRYVSELRSQHANGDIFRMWALAAIIVLGIPHKNIQFNINSIWPAARAALVFAVPEDITEKIEAYKSQLADLKSATEEMHKEHKSHMLLFAKYADEFKQRRSAELSKEETEYAERLNQADQKIAALEAAYSKKLQLEAPAQYWKDLARSYLQRGLWLLLATFLLGIIAVEMLFRILLNIDSISIFNQTELNLMTIRGSLILIVITSIAGYLLHLFTKLAISSFHLSRDYRERFQLTCVFLALLRDGDVKCDDQVKQIVMQSIFSRSDTGLLKGEHSFAIPIVSDVLKTNKT